MAAATPAAIASAANTMFIVMTSPSGSREPVPMSIRQLVVTILSMGLRSLDIMLAGEADV
jgi:hypothetical protein